MSIIHVTEATVGAPNSGRMSGTAGDLYAMLKYALPLNGWAVEYDDAVNFGAVFRPGSGNRFRLFVLDNATASGDARLALVRGCENASAATTAGIVDPFPLVTKVADSSSNMLKSSVASTTARNFDIYVGTTWVFIYIAVTGLTTTGDIMIFGDMPPTLAGDPYNTICTVRNTTGATTPGNAWNGVASTTGNLSYNFTRSYDGTVKSTTGGAQCFVTGAFGTITNAPTAQSGPTTGIDRCKPVLSDTGTQTTTMSTALGLPQRAYIPNIWIPLHSGRNALNSRDTFTDTSYNASATFKVFTGPSNGFLIVEETDTWSPP